MYEQVLENLRKATEQSIQMQQEMMRKWAAMLPQMPAAGPAASAASAAANSAAAMNSAAAATSAATEA